MLARTQDLRDYTGLETFFGSRKKDHNTGEGVPTRVGVGTIRATQTHEAFGQVGFQVQDGIVGWNTVHLEFIERIVFDKLETEKMSGEDALLDYVDFRFDQHYKGNYEKWENQVWTEPLSHTDRTHIRGVPYYVRRIDSAGTPDLVGGFNGDTLRGNFTGSGTTTMGSDLPGLTAPDASAAANRNIRANNASHGGIFTHQTFRTLRSQMDQCKFKPPPKQKAGQFYEPKFSLYMPPSMHQGFQDYVNAGPDNNNGNPTKFKKYALDMAEMAESVAFLETLSYLPIYGLNLTTWEGMTYKGNWMREYDPQYEASRPTMVSIPMRSSINMRCLSPRSNLVCSYVAGS